MSANHFSRTTLKRNNGLPVFNLKFVVYKVFTLHYSFTMLVREEAEERTVERRPSISFAALTNVIY